MEKIINMTRHNASSEQKREGVADFPSEYREQLQKLLTFEELPSSKELLTRAHRLAQLAKEVAPGSKVMIGGAPYLMSLLERELRDRGMEPVYAFSKRDVVEEEKNGSVVKRTVFRHLGFVSPVNLGVEGKKTPSS